MTEHQVPEEEVVETEPKQSKWPFGALAGLFFAGFLTVIAWNVEIPYLAYSAGPVSDVAHSIRAEEVETFRPGGELLMLTVISQSVNLFEAVVGYFDSSIDLIRREAVRRPGETDEEYRARALQQMDDSNFRSIAVALDYLGHDMVPVEVMISEFVPGVPAESVLELGDTILAVNGMEVRSFEDIGPLVSHLPPGTEILLTVRRGGEESLVRVELAEREDDPGVSMIGVVLGNVVEPPFPVSIHAGNIGGPSAGMMHTLAIIDTLSSGNLTKGHVIAGTGTIREDRSVGAIGGVRQKVVAAEAAGASYILVPEANYATALTAERSRIQVVPVSTLEDAIVFLEGLPTS